MKVNSSDVLKAIQRAMANEDDFDRELTAIIVESVLNDDADKNSVVSALAGIEGLAKKRGSE